MDDKPILPGQWIDDLPEPLETVADVKDLFERVDKLKAARLEAAILRASKELSLQSLANLSPISNIAQPQDNLEHVRTLGRVASAFHTCPSGFVLPRA